MEFPGAPIEESFYEGDPLGVARSLIGCLLCRTLAGGELLCGRIVESEAYSQDDPASHSYRGMTKRNKSMFGPAGHAYVYRIYGVHYCFNVVCGPAGCAGAVLIRAIEPVEGVELMWQRRFGEDPPDGAATVASAAGTGRRAVHNLTSGPGKLCQALDITREEIDGTSLISGPVRIFPEPSALGKAALPADGDEEKRQILIGPRIGISIASHLQWRFAVAGNPFVSRPLKGLIPE